MPILDFNSAPTLVFAGVSILQHFGQIFKNKLVRFSIKVNDQTNLHMCSAKLKYQVYELPACTQKKSVTFWKY